MTTPRRVAFEVGEATGTTIVVVEDGRPVVDSISIRRGTGPPLTGDTLRRNPLATIITGEAFNGPPPPPPSADRTTWAATASKWALRCGRPPTVTVAEELGVPRSTASRHIASARRRGLLTAPAPHSKAAP